MLKNVLFEALLDIVPFRAYVVDIETYEVVYSNQLMSDSMILPKSKKCFEKVFGQNKICSWCSIKKSNENNISEFFDEMNDKWFVTHDKYIYWLNDRKAKYSILVDISEQKEAQGKIISAHTKLSLYTKHLKIIVDEQLSKLRKQDQLLFFHQKQTSLNEIMSVIAHQWKQPLNELSINNIYLNEKNRNSKYKRIYEDNNEIIQFLSSTISSFQNFYKSSIGNKFLVVEAIESTISILNSSMRQYNIVINFIYDEEIELNGERNSFSQIILSILENAISIFIERNIIDAQIDINLQIVEKTIIINIEDNAGGIEEKNIPHIFENTKSFRKKPSSGLGLYISNLLITEKFNGKLSVKNGSEGAIFTIQIKI